LYLHAAYGARAALTAVGCLKASRRLPFQLGTLLLISCKIELRFESTKPGNRPGNKNRANLTLFKRLCGLRGIFQLTPAHYLVIEVQ
jgi:hypothetical protein